MTDQERDQAAEESGPFWDAVHGRAPLPRAAATLGFEFIDADLENRTIELAFTGTEAFTNPTGNVLGAFQAAMLYDTVGPALLATLEPDQFQSTLEMSVHFLRPVPRPRRSPRRRPRGARGRAARPEAGDDRHRHGDGPCDPARGGRGRALAQPRQLRRRWSRRRPGSPRPRR